MKLFNWLFSKPKETVVEPKPYRRGFLDLATGKAVDIDPVTREEVFIDGTRDFRVR